MEEIWIDIVGWEGLYRVSTWGRVGSFYNIANHTLRLVPKILKGDKNRGYLMVRLYKDGKSKGMYIHRLVALAFIPNPDKKRAVNHKDHDRLNNNVENLEWVSTQENIHHEKTNKQRTSKYIGIYYHKGKDRWCISIRKNRKPISQRQFRTEELAYEELKIKIVEFGIESKYINHNKKSPTFL